MWTMQRVLCGLALCGALAGCAGFVSDRSNGAADAGSQGVEQGCTSSGGTISATLCCESADDFPNSCLVGACGCAPTSSHEVKTCECPAGKCFDGSRCVGR